MSCAVSSTRLYVIQGDTARLKFTITQPDCISAEDLTPFDQITFTIKRSNQDSDAAAIWQGTLAASDIAIIGAATDGIVEVTIPPTATKLLRIGRGYYWDVQIKSDQFNIYTPSWGLIFARSETTKE